jgi:hypothetical protein
VSILSKSLTNFKELFNKVLFFRIYNDIKEVHASLPVVKAAPVPVVQAAPVPVVKVAPVPVVDVAPVPVETPIVSVAAEPVAEVKNDDIAVVGVTSSAVPYGLAPVHSVPYAPYAHYYAPQQGYYQAPVAPVVQTPVHAPVSYYAPHHGYQPTAYHAQPAVVPAPVTYQAAPVQAPVSAPAPGHSQFHAQVFNTLKTNSKKCKLFLTNSSTLFIFRMSLVDTTMVMPQLSHQNKNSGHLTALSEELTAILMPMASFRLLIMFPMRRVSKLQPLISQ